MGLPLELLQAMQRYEVDACALIDWRPPADRRGIGCGMAVPAIPKT
jgi:hypothetical protein